MSPHRDILACHADRIASLVAEFHDIEDKTDALRDVLHRATACAAAGASLEIDSLREAGLDDALIAKLLRSALFEFIEALRAELGEPEFADVVLALRSAIHPAIPRPQVNAGDRDFFRRLLTCDCEGLTAEHRRLMHLFEDVVLAFPDIVYVHDLNGMLVYMNMPGLKVTKFSSHDLRQGLSVYDLIAPEYTDLIETRLESPGAVSRAPYVGEVYSKDGERVPFEFTTRCIKREGSVVGVIGLARDLRLARRLESEIRRSNLYLDTVVSNAPIGIVLVDGQCMVLDANPAAVALFGAPGVNILTGNPFYGLFEQESQVLRELLFTVLKEEKEARSIQSQTTAFGAVMNCELKVVPLRQEEGGCIDSLLILMTDLTSQIELEQNLVQSEKLSAIGEIVAGVAHELNNPLTGILGYAQLVLSAKVEPSLHARIEHIASEAERCRKIVQNLLSFARHYDSEKTVHNANDILSEVLQLREYQIRIDGIDLEINLAPDLPNLCVDSHELQRVFLNIVNNAQQALATVQNRRKKLVISTFAKDKWVHVRFEDNGPGIPESIQTKVFDPFFTTKGVGEGTGLGLSVSYGVVKEHGGRIDLESKEGKGAAFTIVLPVPESAP
jgi:PAS domain S-box-containing protein